MDAPDFPTALRSALRQAPDVIVVGEMRDPETMRIALAAAETGHLVFATVHATDMTAAVSRIADAFPTERQNAVRQELAMALGGAHANAHPRDVGGVDARRGVAVGQLRGAAAHSEECAAAPASGDHYHPQDGIVTFEESLAKLVEQGVLDSNEARMRAPHPEEFDSIRG